MLFSPTAALLIIGNEILSGQTQDLNVSYLARQLFLRGIDVKEVRFILDCKEAIIEALHALRTKYTFVFTTGGIGPTHDDITAACVAEAFGVSLYSEPEAVRRLYERYPNPKAPEALMRMSYIPEGAQLIDNPLSAAPGFQIENVYVLAGVPPIMQAMFETLLPRLQMGIPKKEVNIRCAVTEGVIAQDLKTIQNTHPYIEIGSYPHWSETEHAVLMVARGRDLQELEVVKSKLIKLCEKHGLSPRLEND